MSALPGTAFFHQGSQRSFGNAVLIEISRREPSFHDFTDLWPLIVKDRVPGRIPISTFENHVVMENSLKAEPKPTRCCARSCIQRIASPLHAPISEVVHGVAKHQVHRLGRTSGTPQRQTEPDRSDFNDSMFWLNIEKACLAACSPAWSHTNGIVNLVVARSLLT